MSASKWKRYPNYSDKGIDWLGEVPEQWDISTPRLMFEEVKDKNTDSARTNFLSLVSKKGIIPYEEKGNMGNKMSVNIDHYTLVNKGDFVLNSMNFGIGGFGVSDYDGITSPAYVVLRPIVEESLTRYLAKIFEDEGFQKGTAILGDGIMELRRAIGWKHLKRQPIPIPPHKERMAIAKFLENGTNAIDELIPALQNMLAKLKEKRSALITQAVTKGLNPDVLMKDSGIDWLGEIPEDWVVGKIKRFCRNLNFRRLPLSSEDRSYRQGKYDYYGASGVIDSIDDYLFDETTVLIAEDGANLVLRNLPLAILAEGKYWVNNHAHILKPNDGAYRYWCELLESQDFNPHVSGSAQPKFTADAIMNYIVAIPNDINERFVIQDFTTSINNIYNSLINKVREKIILLQEFKISLISAAVTGKIDVRGQA